MLTHPQFDPIALSLGPVAVRWYGLMYVVALVLFVALGRLHTKRRRAAWAEKCLKHRANAWVWCRRENPALIGNETATSRLACQLPRHLSEFQRPVTAFQEPQVLRILF